MWLHSARKQEVAKMKETLHTRFLVPEQAIHTTGSCDRASLT